MQKADVNLQEKIKAIVGNAADKLFVATMKTLRICEVLLLLMGAERESSTLLGRIQSHPISYFKQKEVFDGLHSTTHNGVKSRS